MIDCWPFLALSFFFFLRMKLERVPQGIYREKKGLVIIVHLHTATYKLPEKRLEDLWSRSLFSMFPPFSVNSFITTGTDFKHSWTTEPRNGLYIRNVYVFCNSYCLPARKWPPEWFDWCFVPWYFSAKKLTLIRNLIQPQFSVLLASKND